MKIVIVGAGEVGFHIASHLAHENKDVVVVDKNADALRRVSENIDVQVIHGSGSSPVVLAEAGIKSAEILLAVTNKDETNLVACLMASMLSPSTKKLARIRNADYDDYHEHFQQHAPHIDTVINPEIEVVKTIDRLMQVPGAVDVGEFADGRIKFIGVYLEKTARLAGVQLSDLPSMLGDERPLIAAVVREDELIIPHGNDRLMAGDLVYFISEEDKLYAALSVFDKHAQPHQPGAHHRRRPHRFSTGCLAGSALDSEQDHRKKPRTLQPAGPKTQQSGGALRRRVRPEPAGRGEHPGHRRGDHAYRRRGDQYPGLPSGAPHGCPQDDHQDQQVQLSFP